MFQSKRSHLRARNQTKPFGASPTYGGDDVLRMQPAPLTATPPLRCTPLCWTLLALMAVTFPTALLMSGLGTSTNAPFELSLNQLPVLHEQSNLLYHNTELLNRRVIQTDLLAEAPWAESHGADHDMYLGAGMLYYSFAYAFQSETIVVLGSGGGFVPRMLRQAQRDLVHAGRPGPFRLILIDAHLPSAGWGSTFYAENEQSVMRQKFTDIRYMFFKTDDAYQALRERGVSIDYLHVDADHSYEQSLKDFENFFSLLSDRGVVSFHDTCKDAARKCRTGVPETIQTITNRLDQLGLQLVDAHYLYRGIAFAIRTDAPALEAPPERRMNFCRNNMASLSTSSGGFSHNARVGALATLGDYYECQKRFNMTALGVMCPLGKRRDSKGVCSKCIPGMTGDDCKTFQYTSTASKIAGKTDSVLGSSEMKQHLDFAALWLAKANAQHVFGVGVSSVSLAETHLVHPVSSVTAVDPLLESPVWTEHQVPALRFLPSKISDVLAGRERQNLNLERVDTFVCLECDTRIPGGRGILKTLIAKMFPNVQTVVLEGSNAASAKLDMLVAELDAPDWSVESNLSIRNNRGKGTKSRRLIWMAKSS